VAQQAGGFDAMVAAAAEALYRDTQPYRYAKYLERHGRLAESMAMAEPLTRGPAEERPWAWAQVANLSLSAGDMRAAVRAADRALALRPDLAIGWENRGGGEQPLGWDEQARRDFIGFLRVMERHPEQVTAEGRTAWMPLAAGFAEAARGVDFQHVAARSRPAEAYELALDHDLSAALPGVSPALDQIAGFMADVGFFPFVDWAAHAALEDWKAVLADLDRAQAAAAQQGPGGRLFIERWILPMRAQALAGLGRGAEAQRVADAAPADCYLCLRMRGVAASARHDAPAAERWFAQAVRFAPSLPAAHAEWGEARLRRGELKGAMAELALAHDRGPRWADPLELWGEALIRQGDPRTAAARFAEADGYAPRWGRNHLRWGEALARQGRTAEARAQFAAARDLDLDAADRARLKVWLAFVSRSA
jgi:tetratricopeptide (TPR) repeat protein